MIPDLSALFSHFLAETLLCIAVPVLLLADLLAGPARRERVTGTLGLLFLMAAFLAAVLQPAGADAMLTRTLRADGLAKAFRLIALGTGVLAGFQALRGHDVRRSRTEFFVLLIGAVVGACLTAAANDLVLLYVAIETLSICGYLLAGFKKEDPKGSEAALKYIIFGAVSSGAMLYGMSLLYGFAGTATIGGTEAASLESVAGAASGSVLFLVAIVLVFAGLAYKIAAAPFQFWCPDVYEGAPTAVAAFLAVASKGAGFAAAIRFVGAVTHGGAGITETLAANNEMLRAILMVVALVTMTLGNVAALRQQNSKRLLAYSAIAHAGYLLLGLSVLSHGGATAVVFYLVVYLFMTLGGFFLVSLVERETGRTDIDAFEGLGFRAPFLAVCMVIFMVSLTGLPPTGGFWAKVFLFREVFAHAGETGNSLFFWGGVIGLLNSVIALYYYMRFVKVMYLCDREQMPKQAWTTPGLDKGLTFALTVPVLVMGIVYAGVYDAALGFTRGVFQIF
ncbi:MAG: NADH-quinone oxidoreductase subunit N [Planctomycetota bacterium]|jgi:NADH-quinone oxidoreductase subunit N